MFRKNEYRPARVINYDAELSIKMFREINYQNKIFCILGRSHAILNYVPHKQTKQNMAYNIPTHSITSCPLQKFKEPKD